MSPRPSFLVRVIDRLIHGNELNTASKVNGSTRGRAAFRALAYDQHEERRLLAAATFSPELGQLVVHGTQEADQVRIEQTGDTVTVTHSEFSTSTFAGSQIKQILFDGQAGDDSFENNTSIPSIANGGTGNDHLLGGSGNDRLVGSSGNDMLSGRAGDDFLLAGIGDDLLLGGDGDDQISGTRGLNEMFGGNGNDVIRGGSQRDLIDGGDGDDSLFGFAGNDQILGGSGIDRIFAGFGDDAVDGNSGNDIIHGQAGNDLLLGGDGDDVLVGGNGNDELSGQLGNDVIRGDRGTDTVTFDSVRDDYRVNNSGTGWRIATLQNAADNRDTTRSVEQLSFTDIVLAPQDAVDVRTTPNPTPNTPTGQVPTPAPTPAPTPGDTGNNGETDGAVDTATGDVGGATGASGGFIGTPFQPRVINEVVTVQPIIVSNDDGTNTSDFFGNAAQQAEILERIDRIYAVAGVDIQFLRPKSVNSTFFNVGDNPFTTDRDPNDVEEVIVQGDRLGLGSRDRLVLDMYFVKLAPAGAGVLGIVAAIGGNGALIESGEDLSTAVGRDNIVTTVAHELGHNLGLTHVVDAGETNLMFPFSQPGVTQDQLSNDVQNEPLFIPELNFFAPPGGQLDVIIASPYSRPIG